MQDRGRRLGRHCGEPMAVVRGPEARVALAESILDRVVQHRGAHVQEGRCGTACKRCQIPGANSVQ